MANVIDDWLPESGKPKILNLVCVFFFSKMLAATQDIAVDGWALTMLKKLVLKKKKTNIGLNLYCIYSSAIRRKYLIISTLQ